MSARSLLSALWKRVISQSPEPARHGETASEEVARNKETVRAVVEGIDGALRAYKAHQDKQDADNRKNRRIAFLAVLVAAFAVAVATIQWDQMKKANRLTRKAVRVAEDGLAEARRSGAENLASTRTSNEHAYRAWLTVKGPKAPARVVSGQPIEIGVVVENTGRSPAQNILTTNTLRVAPSTTPIPDKLDRKVSADADRGVLGPGSTSELPFKRGPLSPDQWARLKDGSLRLYLLGEVRYSDEFSANRGLDFCFYYVADNDFGPCSGHNKVW